MQGVNCVCTLCGQAPTLWVLKPDSTPDILYTAQAYQRSYLESSLPNLLMLGPRGSGKALALYTPLPTPDGGTTMRDVVVGDSLIGRDGRPTLVTWKSEAHFDPTGTYRLTFDDGEEIVCGGAHEWFTLDKREATRTKPGGSVKRTEDIVATLKCCHGRETNHRVPLCGAWQLSEQVLPIDPYVLGAWLGDGSAGCSNITTHDIDILVEIEKAGYDIVGHTHFASFGIKGLAAKLRRLDARDVLAPKRGPCAGCGHKSRCMAGRGLCARCYRTPAIRNRTKKIIKGFRRYTGGVLNEKRIPTVYLCGSVDQRLALLQGLMDTDGYCSPTTNTVEFCNTNIDLAYGVYQLALSLGLKPNIATGRATLYGRDCGPKFRVCWTATLPVFRLQRKLVNLPAVCRPTQSYRYIVKAERVPDVPLQCVEVDAPDHLYLCGASAIPTHNSLTMRSHAHMCALSVPKYRYLIMRRTTPELKKSHLIHINDEMNRLGGYYNSTDMMAYYPNGSIGFYGHCSSEAETTKYLSAEYDLVIPDEATTFPEEVILRIASCARVPLGSGRIAMLRGGTNKLGRSAEFIKRYFIDKDVSAEDNPDYYPDDYGVIEHSFTQNRALDTDQYRKRLQSMPAHVRQAWIDNEWVIDGQYFMDFQAFRNGEPWHVITEMPKVQTPQGPMPLLSQSWVTVYRAVDWGYHPDPAVCLWIAVLPNKRSIVFKERTWKSTLAADVARQIRAESAGMRVVTTFCDPTMKMEDGRGQYSIGEIFEQNGVPITPSVNKRDLYGYAIHEYLNTLIDGKPQMQLLAQSGAYGCPQLIKTLPTLQADPKDPNKVGDGNDHWAVALAYFCMSGTEGGKEATIQSIPRWMMTSAMRQRSLWRMA